MDPGKLIFGAIVVGGFFIVGALFFHWLMTRATSSASIVRCRWTHLALADTGSRLSKSFWRERVCCST